MLNLRIILRGGKPVKTAKKINMISLLFPMLFICSASNTFAGPCEDFARDQARYTAEAEGEQGNPFALLSTGTTALGVLSAEKAACEQLRAGQQMRPRIGQPEPQPAGTRVSPHMKYYGPSTGYGPQGTGSDWSPLSTLLDLRPNSAASRIREGDRYETRGYYDAAAQYYKQALKIDPNNQTARERLDNVNKMRDCQHSIDCLKALKRPGW